MLDTLQRPSGPRTAAAGVPAPRPARDAERRGPAPVLRPAPSPRAGDWLPGGSPGVVPPRVHRTSGQVLPARDEVAAARRLLLPLGVNLALLGALAALLGLAVGPHTGEYRTLTMLTGSMRPQFPAGSVVVVTPQRVEDLRAGHVITFHAPTPDQRVVTHRVTRIDRSGPKPVVETKGDANAGTDPWKATLEEPVVWRARFAVPLLGDALIALRDPRVQLAATKVLPGALVGWLLWSIWRPARTP